MNILKKLFGEKEIKKENNIDESQSIVPDNCVDYDYIDKGLEKMFEDLKYTFYNKGFEDGVKSCSNKTNAGFDKNKTLRIYKNDNIPNEEFESFIRYLIVNNLELYYSNEGFMIRKK